jgi:hypothetical protein
MIAPVCDICEEGKDGGFLQFRVIAQKEIEFNELLEKEPEMEGHPYGNRYFCTEHLEIAKKYCHLTYAGEASDLIIQEIASPKK